MASGDGGAPSNVRAYDFKVSMHGRSGATTGHKLFLSSTSNTMRDAVEQLGKRIDSSSPIAGDDFVERVVSVKCSHFDLWQEDCQNIALSLLHSESSPIETSALIVKVNPVDGFVQPPKRNVTSVLMASRHKEASYLEYTPDDSTANLDQQVKNKIRFVWHNAGLGYNDESEKKQLEVTCNKLSNVLCFVTAHWDKLFGVPFPTIPKKHRQNLELLKILTSCTRRGRSKSQLTKATIQSQIDGLHSLNWTAYSQKSRFRVVLDKMEDEFASLLDILFHYKHRLTENDDRVRSNAVAATVAVSSGPTRSKEEIKVIEAVNREPPKSKGIVPSHVKSRRSALALLSRKLVDLDEYEPLHLSDEDLGIPSSMKSPSDRSHERFHCKREMVDHGLQGASFLLHSDTPGGQHPSRISIFRVPPSSRRPDNHEALLVNAVDKCRNNGPRFTAKQDVKRLNALLRNATGASSTLADHLRRTIQNDSRQPISKDKEDALVEFLNGSGGEISDEVILDMRTFNSRGGEGGGSNKFELFYEKCIHILHNHQGSAAHERRHSGATESFEVLYASEATSISDLISQATKLLEADVEDEALDKMPPIPSNDTVRLQFVPNNAMAETAAKMTGRLQVKRNVQSRTIRDQHEDQHYVSAMTRYCLEWSIETSNACKRENLPRSSIEFMGQDDKAKIPVGKDVPVSTNVRPNKKAIVPVESSGESRVKAADHDWSCSNIVPSVTLRSNIPDSMSGSFYGGGSDGTGEVEVVLRDAVFDASNVFNHMAQLAESLTDRSSRDSSPLPLVLVLQTDGGPDHNLTFMRSKLAFVALCLLLDLDHGLAIRGAPHGSYLNKVERPMSLLNFGLMHAALMRAPMAPWAEERMKSVSSMKEVREAVVKFNREKESEQKRRDADAAATTPVRPVVGIIEEDITIVVDPSIPANATLSAFAGRDASGGDATDDEITATAARNGCVVLENEAIAVARAERLNTLKDRDLKGEWEKSMKAPIDEVGGRFSRLSLDGRPVLVKNSCKESTVDTLRSTLIEIDGQYTNEIRLQADWSKVPKLHKFFDDHVVSTPYSLSFQKCGKEDCANCKPLRSPESVKDLVMQRQPTPRKDPSTGGDHFLSRNDAVAKFAKEGSSPQSLVDLSDLPSKSDSKPKAVMQAKKKTDTSIGKSVKGWSAMNVRACVACWSCGKERLLFSSTVMGQSERKALEIAIESKQYVCGSQLFPDDEREKSFFVQRIGLTCESPMEGQYYSPTQPRALKFPNVCCRCGEGGNVLLQEAIEAENLSNGYNCFPICRFCVDAQLKPIPTTNRKNKLKQTRETQARKKAKKASIHKGSTS